MEKEVYLGDGLYASFDGWQINLRAPRGNENHIVCLDSFVFEKLIEFHKECYKPKTDGA